jgi:hypothetical protein
MDITKFPNDLFDLVVSYLQPKDCIRCRRVARRWHAAFTNPQVNRYVLQNHFPRAREIRDVLSPPYDIQTSVNWPNLLSNVAARYDNLLSGTPQSIEKHVIGNLAFSSPWPRHRTVGVWQRYLQFEEKTAPFHYLDTLWTYDLGLLVYPSTERQDYMLYDLSARTFHAILFDPTGKFIRRIRLSNRVLVIEWCEDEPYHQLNESEFVHRHFATAWDIVLDPLGNWTSRFRSEWQIHFLGLPINYVDRFYSCHNSTHYALYLWQPNRGAWGEDDPLETLIVWDISAPSSYRPSDDPTFQEQPLRQNPGPTVVWRFSFSDLDFYGIRQRSTPVLRGLELDEGHVYVVEEDHRWLVGVEAGHTRPRLHKVKTTGIPFVQGPVWVDECGADGDVNLSFCSRRRQEERRPGMAPCWRHEVRRAPA